MRLGLLGVLCLGLVVSAADADQITLINGDRFSGTMFPVTARRSS